LAGGNKDLKQPLLANRSFAMDEQAAPAPVTSRRHFLDIVLGASFLGWLVSIAYPIIRYLKPLPQTGATGPTRLTRDEASKLEQNKFVIVPVSGQRVIVLQAADQLHAFSAKCTHEGCTVTFLPGQSVIWCPCHDGRFDLNGRVLSGPPPRPLPPYIAQRQPDSGIVVSEERALT
jgi:cytochrome b6-f complex iron-sulfur subunit